jgi:uncharacterized protein
MENIIEYPPRNGNIFPRTEVVDEIYRHLQAGHHVYLAAPRRSGKTTLLHALHEQPREGFLYKYLPLSGISDFAQYFETLQSLRHETEGQQQKMVVLVNEYQQAVETIMRQEGPDIAMRFLQRNQRLRMQEDSPLHFVLSGSRSLYLLAERLDAPGTLDDLRVVDLPPLSQEDARDLLRRLLFSVDVSHTDAAIDHLINRIRWLTPFHIQLAAYELIEDYFTNESLISEAQTDKVFSQLTQSSNVHFEPCYKRVQTIFNDGERNFALHTLYRLAREETLSGDDLRELARSLLPDHQDYRQTLAYLAAEGYINVREESGMQYFMFASPLLRRWWRQVVPSPETADARSLLQV